MTSERSPTLEELLRHETWLRGLLRQLLAEHDIDDVLQQTWTTALRSPPRSAGAARRWLARVATNFARRSLLRTQRRRRHESQAAQQEAEVATDTVVERLAMQQVVTRAVTELPEPYRTAVFLRYYDGLSYAEIGRRTEVSEFNARQRVRRGLDWLRGRLDETVGDDWRTRPALLALLVPMRGTPVGMPAVVAAVVLIAVVGTPFVVWRQHSPDSPGPPDPGVATEAPAATAPRSPVPRTALATPPTESGGSFDVAVRWASGEPAPGVWVALRPLGDASWLREQWLETDARGRATITASPAGGTDGPLLVRGDRGGEIVVPAAAERPLVVEMRLPAGTTVTGEVVDRFGEPVPDARIWISAPERGLDEGVVATTTDASGRFALAEVSAGRLVGALATGHTRRRAATRSHPIPPASSCACRCTRSRVACTVACAVPAARRSPAPRC